MHGVFMPEPAWWREGGCGGTDRCEQSERVGKKGAPRVDGGSLGSASPVPAARGPSLIPQGPAFLLGAKNLDIIFRSSLQ